MRRCKTERAKTTKLFPRQYWWAVPTLLITLLLATQARAAVIERDWKTPGDGLLTFDTVNQREWLDLSETLLRDFGSSYDNVVAETLPGGMFQDFRLAKSNDVIALAQSAGINTNTLDFDTNSVATENLTEFLGVTLFSSGNSKSSFGFLDDYENGLDYSNQLLFIVASMPLSSQAGVTLLPRGYLTIDRPAEIVGVMLYRNVPEPSSVVLLLTLLLFRSNVFLIRR